jgi:transcriptional regulator with XRE-family HTH domain
MPTIRETFIQSGHNLQRARIAKGMSVAVLALLSGVDEETIESMENGNFDVLPDVLFELAAALNVEFEEILVDRSPGSK